MHHINRRFRIFADLTALAAQTVPAVLVYIAHFWRERREFPPTSPICDENGGDSHRTRRSRSFSASSMGILAVLTENGRGRRVRREFPPISPNIGEYGEYSLDGANGDPGELTESAVYVAIFCKLRNVLGCTG